MLLFAFCRVAFFPFLSEIVATCSKMVKVSFNTALAQKDVKKDAETLIPEEDKVSRKWLTANSVLGGGKGAVKHKCVETQYCCLTGLLIYFSFSTL